mmetsp:Transcript_17453/g.41747  ORF Transcript_17453/g.41747 Transcript_17453/m.41747 type:complete len:355 (-) Transcript_17453:192-1256(-)|eukprot:CAMPEP_0177617850 /NCGR_PEP_ID=MMETSP0419_2-20121207/25178_1 /TAXON_ID=582737 /ORGANISM="Tetraselmis sp., Strain GSL018" /LENGTH=354 /DNA_ID=CAMNT_0019116541 /DNA_START=411 /DNA_END=1475 /DNA_ORIENTATION=-
MTVHCHCLQAASLHCLAVRPRRKGLAAETAPVVEFRPVLDGDPLAVWTGLHGAVHLVEVVVALEAVPVDVDLLAELHGDRDGAEAGGPFCLHETPRPVAEGGPPVRLELRGHGEHPAGALRPRDLLVDEAHDVVSVLPRYQWHDARGPVPVLREERIRSVCHADVRAAADKLLKPFGRRLVGPEDCAVSVDLAPPPLLEQLEAAADDRAGGEVEEVGEVRRGEVLPAQPGLEASLGDSEAERVLLVLQPVGPLKARRAVVGHVLENHRDVPVLLTQVNGLYVRPAFQEEVDAVEVLERGQAPARERGVGTTLSRGGHRELCRCAAAAAGGTAFGGLFYLNTDVEESAICILDTV